MNQVKIGGNKINPLEYLSNNPLLIDKIMTEFEYQSVRYQLYFENRKLVYATHSISPKERLERHLKKLSHRYANLKGIWHKIHKNVDDFTEVESDHTCPLEYRIITWLIREEYLDLEQSKILGKNLTIEILESLLLIDNLDIDNINSKNHTLTQLYDDELNQLIEIAQKNINNWRNLYPEIQSPYQRPYLAFDSGLEQSKNNLSLDNRRKLAKVLRGFDFLQLGAIFNQEEVEVARKLYPLIRNKTIILREPRSQFSLLPKIYSKLSESNTFKDLSPTYFRQISPVKEQNIDHDLLYNNFFALSEKSYKIACIDDSPIILKSLSAFLNRDNITVFPIANAAKAMMLLNSVKPDLIFMDISMPLIDGYQLCSLLRKNNKFKDIPIIMLTGNTGFIDRAKAKMAGATDYMTKPFKPDDLLKIIFRYLSDS